MAQKPSQNWSVVVLGRWNRAILNPLWIGKHLLGVDEGQELQIAVPMDNVGPFKVKNSNLVVAVSDDRLVIEAAARDFSALGDAIAAAKKTMQELEKTPVTAAGVNVAMSCSDDEKECINHMWTTHFDRRLGDGGYPIQERVAARRLQWKSGQIMFRVSQDNESQYECLFNFEKRSDDIKVLMEWLTTPIQEIEATVKDIQGKLLEKMADAV